jgi:hypothetical protein
MEAQKISLWGAADIRRFATFLDETGKEFQCAIAWAIPMNPLIMAGIQNGPNQAYADEYIRVNNAINGKRNTTFSITRDITAEFARQYAPMD